MILDYTGTVLVLTRYVSLGCVEEVEQFAVLSSLHLQQPGRLCCRLLAADQPIFWQDPLQLLAMVMM